jgi:beta-glucosidase
VLPRAGTYRLIAKGTCTLRLFVNGEKVGENIITNPPTWDTFGLVEHTFDVDPAKPPLVVVEHGKSEKNSAAIVQLMGWYDPDPLAGTRLERAVSAAKSADAAVVFVGLPDGFESEGGDRSHMRLTGGQDELVSAMVKANPNTAVVVHAGSPVAMPWIDEARAVILALYAGQELGHALAAIITGGANPSGKLPVTLPERIEDTPAWLFYPGERTVHYGEGIFVGYRYYDRRDIAPLFPFGHGLSYTGFKYSGLKLPRSARRGEEVKLSLTVANTGDRRGKETVQVYVRDCECAYPRPVKELKAFAKIDLAPGKNATVSFKLAPRDFSYFHPVRDEWTEDPGAYEILVGSSSRDIRLKGTVKLVD